MKVLVCDYMVSPHHFEVALESCLDLARQGFVVEYRNLYLGLPETEFAFGRLEQLIRGLTRLDILARTRLGPLARGFQQLQTLTQLAGVQIDVGLVDSKDIPAVELPSSNFESLEELKKLKFGPARVGLGTASSLISFSKNSLPKPSDYEALVSRSLEASIRAFSWLELKLQNEPEIEFVSVFNGRFAVARSLADCAEHFGRNVLYRERGPNMDNSRYFHEEFSPHNTELLGKSIKAEWESALIQTPALTRLSSSSFFDWARSGGQGSVGGFSIPGGSSTEAPLLLDESRRIVVFFTSSEDEFEANVEGVDSIFKNQAEAALYLQKIAHELDFQLIVRVHPRVATLSKSERDTWDKSLLTPDEHVIIVESSSQLSSYDLIEKADLVVAWVSTILSESVYMGKPSLSLARSTFVTAGVDILFPSVEAELREIFQTPSRLPDSESSLIRGFAAFGMGRPLKHYLAKTAWRGYFHGTDLFFLANMMKFVASRFPILRRALRRRRFAGGSLLKVE